jgi:WD40 repeat protein
VTCRGGVDAGRQRFIDAGVTAAVAAATEAASHNTPIAAGAAFRGRLGDLAPYKSQNCSGSRTTFKTDEEIGDVALSMDGKQLATTGLDKISIFRTNDGQPEGTLPGHNPGGLVQGVAFSPDGRMPASSALDAAQTALGCAGCDIILWDLERNMQLATLMVIPRHLARGCVQS